MSDGSTGDTGVEKTIKGKGGNDCNDEDNGGDDDENRGVGDDDDDDKENVNSD